MIGVFDERLQDYGMNIKPDIDVITTAPVLSPLYIPLTATRSVLPATPTRRMPSLGMIVTSDGAYAECSEAALNRGVRSFFSDICFYNIRYIP